MSDLISGKSDCNKCVWGTRDGGCASWECEFIDRDDAVKAWRRLSSAEPKVLVGDLISREYMKSLGGACLAQRLKDGDLCPIISIDLLPSAEPEIAENLYLCKCCITDKDGLQHEVIHTGDIRRVTGWEI